MDFPLIAACIQNMVENGIVPVDEAREFLRLANKDDESVLVGEILLDFMSR